MTFRGALPRASRREIEQIVEACHLPLPLPDTASLTAQLMDPARIGRVLAGLRPAETAALQVVWLGGHGQAGGEIHRHLQTALRLGDQGAAALQRLAGLGLLLPLTTTGGRYVVPEEAYAPLAAWSARSLAQAAAGSAAPEPLPACPDAATALADFIRLLGALRAGVDVAAAGHVYKREQQRLAGWLAALPGEPPEPPPAAWARFEPRLGLHLALAAGFDLVRQRRQPKGAATIWATAAGATDFAARAPWTQWWGLCQSWIHLLAAVHPVLPEIVVVAVMNPVAFPERAARFWDDHTPYATGGVAVRSVPFLLFTGWLLGALQVGRSGGEAVVAATPAARAVLDDQGQPDGWPAWEERFFVQSDFTIVAPAHLHPRHVLRLSGLCRPERIDRASTLRLHQQAVAAAARGGQPAEATVAYLAEASRGLPQNVGFTLREWAGLQRRTALERVLVLRLDGPDVAERLRGLPALCQLVREEVTPNVWLCPAEAGPRLWRLLAEAGCEPRGDIDDVTARPAATATPRPREERAGLPWPGPNAYTPRFELPTDELSGATGDAPEAQAPARPRRSRGHPARRPRRD